MNGRILWCAAMATAMAACSPAPTPTDEVPKKLMPPARKRAKSETVVSPEPALPEAEESALPHPSFADGWVAVAVKDDGQSAFADVLDPATGRHLQARRPPNPGEPEFVRFEKSDGGDAVVLRFEGSMARIPFIAQGATADGGTGFRVWSDPMDGLPADASVPVFNSPMDGIPAEEIAAAPTFQSVLDSATNQPADAPVLQETADPVVTVTESPLDPLGSRNK